LKQNAIVKATQWGERTVTLFFSHRNIVFDLRPRFHGRNNGVKQGLGVYYDLQFGSLRAISLQL
jgi:hypothetical protein